VRIQGALISDDEIEKVISYVKDNNGEAVYDEILMEAITDRVKTIAIPVRDRKPVDETELLYRKNDASLFSLIRRRKSPRFNEVYDSVRKIHPSVIRDKRFDELYARVNSGRYNNNNNKKSAGEC